MTPETLQWRLEYVRDHVKEIHLFGTRADGLEICIVHGELRAPGRKLPQGQPMLDQF